LNYHSKNDFVVDFDNIWKWVGFSRKDPAKRLLENSDLRIDDITNRVGYADVSSFRRLFKREVDLSPTEYRKHFSNAE